MKPTVLNLGAARARSQTEPSGNCVGIPLVSPTGRRGDSAHYSMFGLFFSNNPHTVGNNAPLPCTPYMFFSAMHYWSIATDILLLHNFPRSNP